MSDSELLQKRLHQVPVSRMIFPAVLFIPAVVGVIIFQENDTAGVLIPEQLTIVSFDNSDLVKLFGLKDFYSFNHPKDRIGEAAARLLLQYINRTRTDPEILTVPTPVEDSQFLAHSVPPLRAPAPSEPGEGPVPPKNP